jgi:predicted O-methyltransferase YrrM
MTDVSEARWADVDRYISGQLSNSDDALESALKASAGAGLRAINVSANQGKFLYLMAKAIGARKILELGTLGGYSAIWLARALPAGGRLVTVEVDPDTAAVARKNFARAGCADLIEVRVGPALEVLPRLEAEKAGPFDFVFIYADKVNYPQYLQWSITLARPGSVIVADNVVRKGAVADATSEDATVQAVRRFYAAVGGEPRVTATAIQTVGVKGYDGFAVILVAA